MLSTPASPGKWSSHLEAPTGEPHPLVLAVALPALEQLDDERLGTLVRTQLEAASPAMLSVLVGLARDRLGPAALADVGILVSERGAAEP